MLLQEFVILPPEMVAKCEIYCAHGVLLEVGELSTGARCSLLLLQLMFWFDCVQKMLEVFFLA